MKSTWRSIFMNTPIWHCPHERCMPLRPIATRQALAQLAKYKVDQTANTQWAALKNLNYEDPEDNEFFDEEE